MPLLTSPQAVAAPSNGVPSSPSQQLRLLVGMTALVALVLIWSFWTTFDNLAHRWSNDPQYSHGYLVPLFALVLLWKRRDQLSTTAPARAWSPSWWGVSVLLGGLVLRLIAVSMDVEAVDAFSLLPTLAGLVLLLGGKSAVAWAWPGIAFLGFMIPLPFFLEMTLSQPLRALATQISTYVLQTCGYPAIADGNTIHIGTMQLMVAQACNGLGMLMTFFALSTAFAVVLTCPLADRLILVFSAIPIAVLANVVRIAATGLVSAGWGIEAGRAVFHDLAGWLMMPLALLLLWLEYRFLARLFKPAPSGAAAAAALTLPGLLPPASLPSAVAPATATRGLAEKCT